MKKKIKIVKSSLRFVDKKGKKIYHFLSFFFQIYYFNPNHQKKYEIKINIKRERDNLSTRERKK